LLVYIIHHYIVTIYITIIHIGINNFDPVLVRNIALAAEQGGASHIDIACDADLVRIAKAATSLPVCVSSIYPASFVAAVEAGADMIEIGNFDGFYEKGIKFDAADILSMAQASRMLVPDVALSVTIPFTLPLNEQVALAIELEKCGVDVIQTEGKMSVSTAGLSVQELIEIAAPTLASAYALSKVVSIPVMCASGLTEVTSTLALAMGSRGVGIGSMVNKLPTLNQMIIATSAVAASVGRSKASTIVDSIIASVATVNVNVDHNL
jgi:hypothetical protein